MGIIPNGTTISLLKVVYRIVLSFSVNMTTHANCAGARLLEYLLYTALRALN